MLSISASEWRLVSFGRCALLRHTEANGRRLHQLIFDAKGQLIYQHDAFSVLGAIAIGDELISRVYTERKKHHR
ncbi:MAG TPA: hypothetical protein VFM48_04600 [Aquabacterium sp.]|nr:hypothetical protein [Aquabacterium sp.]